MRATRNTDQRVPATIEYTCDWTSGDEQRGHIRITTATGVIEGTWDYDGGNGHHDLVSNSTQEFDDADADELLDSPDTCQGNGTYTADIVVGEYGWYGLDNVAWPAQQD